MTSPSNPIVLGYIGDIKAHHTSQNRCALKAHAVFFIQNSNRCELVTPTLALQQTTHKKKKRIFYCVSPPEDKLPIDLKEFSIDLKEFPIDLKEFSIYLKEFSIGLKEFSII